MECLIFDLRNEIILEGVCFWRYLVLAELCIMKYLNEIVCEFIEIVVILVIVLKCSWNLRKKKKLLECVYWFLY